MIVKNPIFEYSKTLYLPKTSFPMKANLPKKELEIMDRWKKIMLYERLRKKSYSLPRYVLHDGPPYANGKIHIGHALNKILKDIIIRSFQMQGYDASYVPGWDCHGLPIEWEIEKKYLSYGIKKEEIPVNEFRKECRKFALHWISDQKKDFQRLGINANFKNPYYTMDFRSESKIAEELMKFSMSGQIYRGLKPVMWSVVEHTALSESEIEYREYTSDSIWIAFSVQSPKNSDLYGSSVLVWTTTPWTIPGSRAVAFSKNIIYNLYEIVNSHNEIINNFFKKIIISEDLSNFYEKKGQFSLKKIRYISHEEIRKIELEHPLKDKYGNYSFRIPLLEGKHVSQEKGTGFVHTAPSHGQEDYEIWMLSIDELKIRGINTKIPIPIDDRSFYTEDAPGFGPNRKDGPVYVIDKNGDEGNANKIIIQTLKKFNKLFFFEKLKHSYPHSWRSRKPIIFRNTPQWFIYMDKDLGDGSTLRERALQAIDKIRFVPKSGYLRLRSMIENRPDWVISRQRSWGVPITLFFNKNGEILCDQKINHKIIETFEKYGSDSWFQKNAKIHFLGEHFEEPWEMVQDILDVWFDAGSTHAFVLKERDDLKWPADVYLEGSDQHRGWFNASLLESCGTIGSSPCSTIITHGFTLDESGKKMSKSLGNSISPQEIIKIFGTDILRTWVSTTNYWEDQKLGENVIKTNVDIYRKLRNVIRWMLGNLEHDTGQIIEYSDLPSLEKFMLNRINDIDSLVKRGYKNFDFKNIMRLLIDFSIIDLSSFYFDIRKDVLYCDPPFSIKRLSSLQIIREVFERLLRWLAPILPFTTEEAWMSYRRNSESIHLEQFLEIPKIWKNDALSRKWNLIRLVRRVVIGAIEIERFNKTIGSSLEANPIVFILDPLLLQNIQDVDLAEVCITSSIHVTSHIPPKDAFKINEISNVFVIINKAEGIKCARSWRYTKDVGKDIEFPEVSLRDANALRELKKLNKF